MFPAEYFFRAEWTVQAAILGCKNSMTTMRVIFPARDGTFSPLELGCWFINTKVRQLGRVLTDSGKTGTCATMGLLLASKVLRFAAATPQLWHSSDRRIGTCGS